MKLPLMQAIIKDLESIVKSFIKLGLVLLFVFLFSDQNSYCQSFSDGASFFVEWSNSEPLGHIEVLNGDILKIEIAKGDGIIQGNYFEFKKKDKIRINVFLESTNKNEGDGSILVHIKTQNKPFSFFLRDVSTDYPIYIPEYNVFVGETNDLRSYKQIESEIKSRQLVSKLQQIENETEETFESAAKHTRDQACPIWLGISRDMRIFEMTDSKTNPGSEMNIIKPLLTSSNVDIPEYESHNRKLGYVIGRGHGVEENITRRLADGVLPILNTTLTDEDIVYKSSAFVSLEKSVLTAKANIGTDFLVSNKYSGGHMFTKEQEELVQSKLEIESNKDQVTVLYYRAVAKNKSKVPRYAWFKTIRPGSHWSSKSDYIFEKGTGFSSFSPNRVFGISKLNGNPLPDEEMTILLKPNEKAIFEFYVPHTPISKERAIRLAKQSFESRYDECVDFWKEKLNNAAKISVPEKRITEMIQAGLLHLDLITFGSEPDGTLAPNIGVYSPIGTESSPIIQFYNSMGLHETAKRSLMFFLDKQHDDGMIQNFGGYMVETGAALWSMGEYFRYTNDKEWVKQVKPKLLKACKFLLEWREKNKKQELRGKGYGMIDGKVADPEDPFHQYMLNAYAYIGISRVAEMLSRIDIENSQHLAKEAEAWKQDIKLSFFTSMANSPVVPLGDGTWCPTVSPWTEATGPRALSVNGEAFYTHGTVTAPDVLIGSLYLVFCEIFSPEEQAAQLMFKYQSELFYQRNCAFSQPYYSRHNWFQLKQGMTKSFLKTYYNTFSSLADRETYTFWEHIYQVSPHKTHEEAWFLMQTRWMLWLEEDKTLKLLQGIPRKWLEDGKKIELKNVASYYGPLSVHVQSNVNSGSIEATIECKSNRMPQQVEIRLPHPEYKKAFKITGGEYDKIKESVIIKQFDGHAIVKVDY